MVLELPLLDMTNLLFTRPHDALQPIHYRSTGEAKRLSWHNPRACRVAAVESRTSRRQPQRNTTVNGVDRVQHYERHGPASHDTRVVRRTGLDRWE
jgi:hypothetical protein